LRRSDVVLSLDLSECGRVVGDRGTNDLGEFSGADRTVRRGAVAGCTGDGGREPAVETDTLGSCERGGTAVQFWGQAEGSGIVTP
jgi:hypothetical protein